MCDLTTNLGGIELKSCLWNAAGAQCTSLEELYELGNSQAGAILSKSCTLEPREGNEHPRYYQQDQPFLTINSTGLANHGYRFYGSIAEQLKNDFDKPYFVSVSGLSESDNLQIIRNFQKTIEIDAIELNLSCPNVIGKPQIGYDFDASNELLRKIFEIGTAQPLGIKLPPYLDQIHVKMMADVIQNYPVKFVTCCNSLGNGLVIDPISETTRIKPKWGLGGIGGTPIKPIALSNVFQFSRELSKTDVIGCGGVVTGMDAFEHILAGARGVQIGSQLVVEGISCFQRIQNELKEIMISKGYQRIDDFQGKVRN